MRDLFQEFLLNFGTELERTDLFSVLADIVKAVVLAELLLDDLHLLTQEILTLVAVHLLIGSIIDLLLNGHDLDLVAERFHKHFKALQGMKLLKKLLLFTVIDAQIVRNIVGDIARITAYNDAQKHLGRHIAGKLHILVKHADAGAHERISPCAVRVLTLIGQKLNFTDEMRRRCRYLHNAASPETFDHDLAQL